MVICLIFVQSMVMIGAEKKVKRTSGSRQAAGSPKSVSLPIPPQQSSHLGVDKQCQSISPSDFSPTSGNSGTIYYSFGRLGEQDFSPTWSSK